ncbi:amino acid adenylation domain-containing protein [Yinghuangia sp. ASG 101]|uniref:non-ribosomal peptide synthetase n=1 Tax=Yinghuangia sp. ASG 101 TaxID=2896848 RepID=UPI001E3BD613|nr:non-ribosomal peptide synthetase [Yinghuangia sp. ASG 101]UGQ10830.1 amino acid adenylation domain-containing protein [Yinghuangia sp. ASG 101]
MDSPSNAAARRRELLRRLRADAGLEANRRDDAIPVRDPAARAPLSSVQHSLWTHHRMYPGSTSYNGCLAVAISGPLDTEALRNALHGLLARHEVLRTTYRVDAAGDPYQAVSPVGSPAPLPVRDLTHIAADDRAAEAESHAVRLASRPFDLSRDHPIRYELLRFAPDEHALVQVVHHIAWDGGTWGVLSRDLADLYGRFAGTTGTADAPPDPRVQYADFATWERGRPVPEAGLSFWRERLAPVPTPTALPADGPRPALSEERGGRRVRAFAPEVADALRDFAAREGVTAFTAALTAFTVVLHRYTGDTDIPVGTLVMDRSHPDVARLVGNFGNTVVLRADLSDGDRPLTFRQAAARLRDVCGDAFGHQNTPFDAVLDAVRPPRRPGRTPLFDTMFGLLTQDLGELGLPGLRTTWRHIHNGTTQFDLALEGFLRPGSLVVEATYREGLLAAETVDRLLGHLETVLAAAIAAPDTPVGRLELLTRDEIAALTSAPATTGTSADALSGTALAPSPVAALIDRQIADAPDRVAVIAGDTTWTYAELDARADAFAAAILGRSRPAGAEPVVALALPRGADLVAALLGVLRSGAAYLPLDLNHPRERIAMMLDDARPDLVVCAEDGRLPDSGVPVLRVDTVPADAGPLGERPAVSPDSPAYVVFTSGSTGRPKAVAGTQRALANRLRWGRDSGEIGHPAPRTRIAKSALTFIDGTTELLGGLTAGDTLVIADDTTATDPAALTALIDHHRIQVVTAVPSLLDTMLDTAAPGSLGSVRTWIVSGEALPASLADTVAARTPGARLVNLYGCSEAAGDSLAHTVGATPSRSSGEGVPIGRPIAETRAYVLDAYLSPVPPGVTGELYLAGHGLARGYLNQPARTAERFVPNPYGPPGTRLYRTGDLASRHPDGTLTYHGRTDHQTKIRGIRIEPAEIELLLVARPDVARAAVTAVPPEPVLCAYVVAAPGAVLDPAALRADLARTLPAQLVPGVFVVLDALPLNANGKVDRAALPAPSAASATTTRRAPSDDREHALLAVFAEFLRRTPDELGVDDDFFALGGHSLLAARVANRVRGELRVEVSVADIFHAPTVAALGRLVAEAPPVRPRVRDFADTARTPHGDAATGTVEAPASFAQAGLWFDEEVRGSSAAYCLPLGVRLRGTIDPEALRAALRDVVARHEALRTVLCAGPDDLPVQRVLPVADSAAWLRFDVVEAGTWSSERLDAEISALVARTFRLDTDLPVRAGLFLRAESDGTPAAVLVLVLHHAAADRWSFTPLLADLARAYEGRRNTRALPGGGTRVFGDTPAVRYTAFAAWQRALLGERDRPTPLAERQLAYWDEALRGAPAETPLPADHPRPATPSHRGGSVLHTLSPALADGVRRVAHDTGASVFMVLHAGVAALLHRHGSGADIVLGAPVSGRTDEDLDDVVGFFVNSVVLRTDVGGDPDFSELVARVRSADLAAFAHADVPFERVVDRLNPERSAARHPVFQVMIAHHRAEEIDFGLSGTEAEAFLPESTAAMFDLELRFVETRGDGIAVHASYATDLFEHDTVVRLLDRFAFLLDAVTADPALRLGAAPVLPPAEREALLGDVDAEPPVAETAAEAGSPVAALIDRQIADAPDRVAVIAGDTGWTYAELDARADEFASAVLHRLRAGGPRAGAEPVVALALPRGVDLVAALLGVLRCGAAYLPLDLNHPRERIAMMLDDARPDLVVCAAPERLPATAVPILRPEDAVATGARLGERPAVSPDSPVYVVFTSGSTGRPKAVAGTQRALANRLRWGHDSPDIGHPTPRTRIAKSALTFIDGTTELLGGLTAGDTLVIADDTTATDPAALTALIDRHRIQVVTVVPSVLAAMLDGAGRGSLASVTTWIVSGEALPASLADTVAARTPGARLVNLYGCSEAAGDSLAHAADPTATGRAVPIGRPISHTRAYVLDARLAPVPPGVTGELYLAGHGLARGYLNQPARTAERFVPNPYGPPGTRLYRTGDLARRHPDGTLTYHGRTDHQTKIRGIRIEPAEIEAELTRRHDVRAAVVSSRPGPTGAPWLVAYVVPVPGAAPEPESVRAELTDRLPEYLVPAAVVVLDALPTNASGKVDRNALPDPERAEPAASVPPSGPVEEALARLFAQLLNADRVGARESFFALGGDSIGATLLAARARKAGLRFTVRDLFRNPSVAALARVVAVDPAFEAAGATGPAEDPRAPHTPEATAPAEPRVVSAPPLLHILREQAGSAGPHGCHIALVRDLPSGTAAWDRLAPACAALIARHDALRLVVTPVSRRLWRTSVAPVCPDEAPVTVTAPTRPEDLAEVVDREVRAAAERLDVTEGRSLRVVGIPGAADGRGRVLVVAHPLAVDETSVEAVADELAGAVVAFAARHTDSPPRADAAAPTDSTATEPAWWTEELRGATPAEPPTSDGTPGADAAAEGGPEATILLPGGAADARAIAAAAFLAALRDQSAADAERLVIERMVDPRRDLAPGTGQPLGAFGYVYPLAFDAHGPLPDVADRDARGASYTALRFASRGGARALALPAVPRIVLRDGRFTDASGIAASWGSSPRWTVEAALACRADGDKTVCRLRLATHGPVAGAWLHDLLDRWVRAAASGTGTAPEGPATPERFGADAAASGPPAPPPPPGASATSGVPTGPSGTAAPGTAPPSPSGASDAPAAPATSTLPTDTDSGRTT